MIKLTKLNNEKVAVNISQIQTIELIPESKIIFVGKDYLIVRESVDEIIEKVVDFSAKVYNLHKYIVVEGKGGNEIKQISID